MRAVNQDVIINRLLTLGVIERGEVRGRYFVVARRHLGDIFRRNDLLNRFAIERDGGYILNQTVVADMLHEMGSTEALQSERPRPTRRIRRREYHTSQGGDIESALERIALDADGVRRSFGLEYEIARLTERQESDLAYLLDTLPPHTPERDGSLSSSGVELVFEPMSEEDLLRTVATLNDFVRNNEVDMDGAGMHITYGVNNSRTSLSDLNIRLNRTLFAIAAVNTQVELTRTFGRSFNSYCRIPRETLDIDRYVAFNPRNNQCWECRLIHWQADMAKIVKIFKAMEFVFHRPFEMEDLKAITEIIAGERTDNSTLDRN